MARIDPSRRGGMDEPRDKLGVLMKNKNIKTNTKTSKSTPHSYQRMLGSLSIYFSIEGSAAWAEPVLSADPA